MSSNVNFDAYELKAPLAGLAYRDSGPVAGSSNYTTIILIHGMGYHNASFAPSFAAASKLGARLVVLNRRDFPGSAPYTAEEKAQLNGTLGSSPEEGQAILRPFMKERAKEINDFIAAFVKQEAIQQADGAGAGGVVLAGWSLGVYWLLAFLRNAGSFADGSEVDLSKYIHRAIIHDSPTFAFGFPEPDDPYTPMMDPSIPDQDRPVRFAVWIGAYFDHASSPDGLQRRTAQTTPPPSAAACDPSLLPSVFRPDLVAAGGSDNAHLIAPLITGLRVADRNEVLFADVDAADAADKYWMGLPVRYLLCDRSIWETTWAARKLGEQFAENKDKGVVTRELTVKTLNGANHFVHWDAPETLVEALLSRE
ncbi:alpha/beta hydrolase family protein [Sarocladium implicatum]|nr:alpha/beta hydrolase family protein [Sarocladium implicatum]